MDTLNIIKQEVDSFKNPYDHNMDVKIEEHSIEDEPWMYQQCPEYVTPFVMKSNLSSQLIQASKKGGRPNDAIWSRFNKSHDNTMVKCKDCYLLVSSKADRLRSHLKKCSPKARESVSVADQTGSMKVPTHWKGHDDDEGTQKG